MARTRSVESHRTKERLADSALDLFQVRGYNGTSVQDLVDAVGAPKGTFYNHYDSKEHLAAEVTREYSRRWNLTALEDADQGTPRERLEQHFAHLVDWGHAIAAERGCLIANFAGELPAHSSIVTAVVVEHLDRWIRSLTAVIEDGKRAGEISSTIPSQDLAEFIVDAWEGGAVRAKASASNHSVDVFARMIALLLR